VTLPSLGEDAVTTGERIGCNFYDGAKGSSVRKKSATFMPKVQSAVWKKIARSLCENTTETRLYFSHGRTFFLI